MDLSAQLQPYVPYPGGKDDRKKCTNCTVHAGFLSSWHNARGIVLPHLSAARKRYADYDLVLVGHSLGGAVAALAGLEMRLSTQLGWKPQVTTFGEPRIGNAAFVDFLGRVFELDQIHPSTNSDDNNNKNKSPDQNLQFRRVTHIDDPVPLLPMEELGYKMHAGEIYISKRNLPPSVSDIHLCDGDQDPRCIAASEARLPNEDSKSTHETTPIMDSSACHVCTGPRSSFSGSNAQSVIPSRYRWEILFAHRDYFYRLGFCVPGGDPSRLFWTDA